MKWNDMLIQIFALCLAAAPFSYAENINANDIRPNAAPTDKSPSAFVPRANFQFENIADGKELVHDFAIQNRGDAPLEVTRVQTG